MKKKFSKILGVGLTLALLCSLLLTAAPVSAVTTPTVTLTAPTAADAYVISKVNTYTILFTTGVAVPAGGDIVVGFMAGTNITNVVIGDITTITTDGIGGTGNTEGPAAIVKSGTYPAAQTLTITRTTAIGAGAIVQITINNVTNPASIGTYSLTVATQDATTPPVAIEAAVTSLTYVIKVPLIAGLPGVASVYNPTGVLMAQSIDLVVAVDAAGVDYTIHVSRGTYTVSGTLNLDVSGLTFVATDGAALTIIDADTATGSIIIEIAAAATGVTVDGFTIENDDGDTGIWCRGDDAIVQNNVVTYTTVFGTGIDISSEATGATVSGNTLNENAAIILHGSTCTVSGNTFGDIMNFWALGVLDGVSITDNNFVSVAAETAKFGILLRGGSSATTISNTLIEGNTIDGRANGGILIGADTTASTLTVTNLAITGNDITNNGSDTGDLDDNGIRIYDGTLWTTGNVIKFNTITGNEDYGIINEMTTTPIDASFNWWGTAVAADIALMVKGTTTGTVDTTPFLLGTADTVFSATAAGTGTALDGSIDVGVAVSGAPTDSNIAVAKYIANPQAAKAAAIAFYDVYVAGGTGTADVTIKFYAGDANTEVYLWSAGTQIWSLETSSFSAYGGYVWVEVDPAMLGGTPFALVAGAVDAPGAPKILAPVSGDDDVSLTPIFAWEAVAGAVPDGYYFEFADNANFVTPMVKLDGDLGRLIVTAYAYVGELPYSIAYYWRVKAVSGTVAAGTLAESAWSTGVFITMAEPEEDLPPVVIEETEPPIIIIEPIVEVVTPAATEITPAWIYIIIGVGGVLVIALLVLIVRTRRVA